DFFSPLQKPSFIRSDFLSPCSPPPLLSIDPPSGKGKSQDRCSHSPSAVEMLAAVLTFDELEKEVKNVEALFKAGFITERDYNDRIEVITQAKTIVHSPPAPMDISDFPPTSAYS